MATQRVNFTTPVGRLVMGSLYKPQTTDADGKPLTVKNGPNVGQPTVRYFFALAVPKNPGEQHFASTEWGQKIWAAGHAGFPQGQANSPTFAWKVVDGDSQVPNSKGKKPCDREGYPGHWVISFSSGFPPKIYNRDGTAAIVEPDAVKLGYFVQVNGDVDANNNAMKPGVYLNHNMVALSAYGPEIHSGPDVAAAGFGAAALPPGASATPVGGFTPQAPAAPAYGQPPMPPAAPPGAIGVPSMSPSSVPNPAFLQVPPPAPAAPAMVAPPAPAAPAAPAPTGPVMTPAANGVSYDAYRMAGWTDVHLRAAGMMV
jgi:hypothetical protein